MRPQSSSAVIRAVLAGAALCLALSQVAAQVHPSARRSNARSAATARLTNHLAKAYKPSPRTGKLAGPPAGQFSAAAATPIPGTTINYGLPNYANSPIVHKFVDPLPGLYVSGVSSAPAGRYIPVAVPDTTTYPGCDYYEIELGQYTAKLHSELPATTLRGYRQTNTTDPIVGSFCYLGPVIIAPKDRPVRIKFTNSLPTGSGGNLFLPVDTTIMGAGMGPDGTMYTQNRGSLHLHGGFTPWISDGTPHQWTVPAGEATALTKGASSKDVPDMPATGVGQMTFYYTNAQSSRLMFYHDHAYGITRLNVYAGEAAGYLIHDPAEEALIAAGTLPGATMPAEYKFGIPLVIQDKGFVNDGTTLPPADFPATGVATSQTLSVDPTWASSFGMPAGTDPAPVGGNLWFPHVYMPNQSPSDPSGANPYGRSDYGPWFFPPWVLPGGGPVLPMPNVSIVPEAFMDTPLVNGAAYPTVTVPAAKVRFRILNACNDRYLNLQLYKAANAGVVNSITGSGGAGYVDPVVLVTPAPLANGQAGPGTGAMATATADPITGAITAVTLVAGGAGYIAPPNVQILDTTGIGGGATATATIQLNPNTTNGLTEMAMVPASPSYPIAWPGSWLGQSGTRPDILDGRDGGVPDPRGRGPAWIQIGSEGGMLPAPVLIKNVPVGYESNVKSITVLNVLEHSLYMGPAERADVVVDFSKYAGKTLLLYNDSPAPLPAGDSRNDYYTGNPDQTPGGGAPPTQPGFGPNTRTIMQIVVSGSGGTAPPDDFDQTFLNNLTAAMPAAFTAAGQDPPIVAQTANGPFVNIQDTSFTFTDTQGLFGTAGATVTVPLQPKTIQELFDNYGRMNATLGVELPFTNGQNQTTIPLGYVDPLTDIIPAGQTQIWKITHNGVDTHAIHFHLVNVQVINRVGWDGMIKPPHPEEMGWKETVKMNPLEDIIVAMQAKAPPVPFTLPDSVRPLDVTQPVGAPLSLVNPADGNQITVSNALTNFGWEYVWHCHLLGHEENDMMRPLVVRNQLAIGCPGGVLAYTGPTATICGVTGIALGTPVVSGGTAPYAVTNNAPATFPVGSTSVVWTATDSAQPPATVTCTQTVTVRDNTPPTITAPANVATNSDTGLCTASKVNLGTAKAADNCPGTVTIANNAPAVFPVGVTIVTWTATDASGNVGSAQQTVTVTDKQAPAITCPANITANNDPGKCSAVVNFTVVATDNCPGVVVVSTPASGSAFPIGTTTVTSVATDASGNVATCSFKVTVVDNQAPTITCPANVVVSAASTSCSAVVNFTVTATDNCPGVILKTTPASGSTFAKGTTTVTSVATDAAGNTSTCSFTVTVNDATPPAVTASASPTSTTNGSGTAKVTISGTATDNCGVLTAGSYVVTDNRGTAGLPSGSVTIGSNGKYSFTLNLSRNRLGTGARIYTIAVTVTDTSGNATIAKTTFTVN